MIRKKVLLNKVAGCSIEYPPSLFDKKYNKTTLFLSSILGMSIGQPRFNMFVKDIFWDDHGLEHDYKNVLFVLLHTKVFSSSAYKSYVAILGNKWKDQLIYHYYVGYDHQEKNHLIMYVVKYPEQFLKDIQSFKLGKYSKLSQELKDGINETYTAPGNKPMPNPAYGAVHKSRTFKSHIANLFFDYRDQALVETLDELWDLPNPEREIFRFSPDKYKLNPII